MNKSKSRRICIVSILLCCLSALHLQAEDPPSFDGDWKGIIKIPDKGELEIRIKIEEGRFTHFFKSNEGWRAVVPKKSYFERFKDAAVAGWINAGGVWTENQTFSLTYIKAGKIKVVWTRHVTNRRDGQDGLSWNLRGEGEFTRAD